MRWNLYSKIKRETNYIKTMGVKQPTNGPIITTFLSNPKCVFLWIDLIIIMKRKYKHFTMQPRVVPDLWCGLLKRFWMCRPRVKWLGRGATNPWTRRSVQLGSAHTPLLTSTTLNFDLFSISSEHEKS